MLARILGDEGCLTLSPSYAGSGLASGMKLQGLRDAQDSLLAWDSLDLSSQLCRSG